jgi:ABC-type branched-subunit amino acid transport system ATPase component
MTPVLAVSDLSSGYGGSTVLREVSLAIGPGAIVALVGKNGMGKTSLLKTIMGFLPARRGKVMLDGRDITATPPHRRRGMALAYAPQERALFQDLSVYDNLRLGLKADAAFEAAFTEVASAFPFLKTRLRQRAGTLSGGEQKMLIVARGLMARPRIFLLDEVTEGLQPSIVDRLAEVLSAARRTHGTAMLMVEQHIPFVLGIADSYAVLERGEIAASGPIDGEARGIIDRHMRL